MTESHEGNLASPALNPGEATSLAAEDAASLSTGKTGETSVTASPSTAETTYSQHCPIPHDLAHLDETLVLTEMPSEEMLYDLADLFKTFGDTTRIKILYALMGAELCVADLASIVGATQSAVSHQLRTLKQARLVKFQRDGKNVIYSLSDNHVYTMLAQGMTHICE